MLFPKRKRVVNRSIIEKIKSQGCVVNSIECCPQTHAHHITSVGAGGDDSEENLIPLCFVHHRRIHDIGTPEMCNRYPKVKDYLISIGREEKTRSKSEKND